MTFLKKIAAPGHEIGAGRESEFGQGFSGKLRSLVGIFQKGGC